MECLALAPIPNGVITYDPDMTADYDVNTVATYTCNEGFILGAGSEPRVCLLGGTWSGLIPVCIGIRKIHFIIIYIYRLLESKVILSCAIQLHFNVVSTVIWI